MGEAGEILGVTRERIRQIEVAALKKLSNTMVHDASAYGRDDLMLKNRLASGKHKQFFEDVILDKYGCVKEYFHNCHRSKISYKNIAERFNVNVSSVRDLAKKHGVGIKEWQERKLLKAS